MDLTCVFALFVYTDALAVMLHVSAEQDSLFLQVCNLF